MVSDPQGDVDQPCDTLTEIAERLATHGYYVVVPNVFYRHGPAPITELPTYIDASTRPEVMANVMPMIFEHNAERVVRDATSYLQFLDAQPEAASGPLAVTGYCIGGLYATQTAAAFGDRIAALAALHAPVAAAGDEVLRALPCRVHFGHAESDLDNEQLRSLNATLDLSQAVYTSEIYPATTHGFTMRDTDTFDTAGMQHHWDRVLALLAEAFST